MPPLLRNVLARGGHVAAGGETSIIALGSNVGNRADAFRRALQEIGHIAKVRQTSFLYESPPYVSNTKVLFSFSEANLILTVPQAPQWASNFVLIFLKNVC